MLNAQEQATAAAAVQGYNAAIAQLAARYGLAVVDVNGLLNQLVTTGVEAGGTTLTGQFILGQAFSLDGVHPTCKGYGVLANALIQAINARYGATIPLVDVAPLPGNALPQPPETLTPAARTGRLGLPEFRGGAPAF